MMRVALLDDFHPLISESFSKWNWDYMDCQHWSLEDFKANAHSLDGIVMRSKFSLNESHLKLANKLKFIARPGSGLEHIDLEYCQRNNIEVFRSPEGNCDALAEHALGMLLSLINNLHKVNIEVKNNIWKREENRGIELKGKVMGIIGFGYMGRAFSERLKGFGMEIIAYDKYKSGFETKYVQEVTLNEIFEKSDFVSLHTPLNRDTIGMVNKKFLEKFKKSFVLINTARGQSVILKDLNEALKSNKILGACLDVLDIELNNFKLKTPLNEHFEQLKKFDNVILSPHIAGWTKESKKKMASIILEKIHKRFILQ